MIASRAGWTRKKPRAHYVGVRHKNMDDHKTPKLSDQLSKRIRLVRRDMGSMLFHFTRASTEKTLKIETGKSSSIHTAGSASGVLNKILHESKLIGTSHWTYGFPSISFTEAPIQEFNSIFSLAEIAATEDERPRYEPYGIAVSKEWLFEQGGRPVIYGHPSELNEMTESQKYRFVPYNPTNGTDFTWEREWRINTESLQLDPEHTLVVLPTSEEAFELVYGFSNEVPEWDVGGSRGPAYIAGSDNEPKWLAVSLDLFGFKYY